MNFAGFRRAALFALLCSGLTPMGAVAEEGRTFMRYPTLHGDSIVFAAHGNLWRVGRTGGVASRLTTDPGEDLMPRLSPDGRWIAFTGAYQGNRDVYVMPAAGGTARRLTFHSDVGDHAPLRWGPDNMVVTWTPDSRNIVFMSRRMGWNARDAKLFEVPVEGGAQTALPLDSGGLMTFSPDGRSIAYNRIFRNFRTWKRYDGGMAQDVYTYDLGAKTLTRITDWKGTETAPMWYGRKIYFLSDHDANRRENIWVHDLDTGQDREVTHFTDYDVDFPSLGVGGADADGVVFQQGGALWVLDLPSETLRRIEVTVPDDGARTGPRQVDAAPLIRPADTAGQTDYALSPNGKRALFSARGDIFSVPADHGATRDLTATSNADEDHPGWSPDGQTVIYTTDVDGEQQLAIRPATGGPERILTHFTRGFLYTAVWSPDARQLAVADANHQLWLVDAASGEAKVVAKDPYGEIHDQAFSPDGLWLAYSLNGPNQQRAIWFYSLAAAKATLVSTPMNNDFAPIFSPNGKYLYFVSTRVENPTFSESEQNVATLETGTIQVATLRKDEPSPFAPRSDEGAAAVKDEGKSDAKAGAGADAKPGAWKPGAIPAIRIDLEGLIDRAVPLPVPPADIVGLDARAEKIVYQTAAPQTISGPLPGIRSALHVYDLTERKDAMITSGLESYSLSADGEKVLVKMGATFSLIDAKAGGGDKPATLDLSHLRMRIEPTQEWAEMFSAAWRLERDLFVNPAMNGVDWRAVRDAYARLLPLVGSRADLNYLIGEMQGELANSHTYVGGGDDADPTPETPTALLGADFALDAASGRYALARIFAGDNSRPAYRGPVGEPGVDVRPGDFLLAVNGQELKAPTDPYSLFVGLLGQPITLTLAPSPAGKRRDVTVTPVRSEMSLREKAWIDHNRDLVDQASGGQIAYIYMSDMESLGMEQFVRQFYAQLNKRALILDDRWNGGGFIDQIILERLRRVLVGMDTNRESGAQPIPQQLIDGPKVTLINGYSASDGDIFPYYFRKYGLGPLIGTRTWGGVRGIRGDWTLLDGGYITVPEDSLYGLKSEWVIENHGVDPDIPVETDPGQLMAGHDAQLQAGVDYLLNALKARPGGYPPPPPNLPAYPAAGQVGPPSLATPPQ
jgi:tricorn protease